MDSMFLVYSACYADFYTQHATEAHMDSADTGPTQGPPTDQLAETEDGVQLNLSFQ